MSEELTDVARRSRAIRDLREAVQELHDAESALRMAVADARNANASWSYIAEALGVSRQAAWERFGP